MRIKAIGGSGSTLFRIDIGMSRKEGRWKYAQMKFQR